MKLVLIAFIAALGLIVAVPAALAQEAGGNRTVTEALPAANGDNAPRNLPPLVLQSPSDRELWGLGSTVEFRMELRQFVVIDDGAESVRIDCTLDGVSKEITWVRNELGYRVMPHWDLGDGIHTATCQVTDEMGLSANVPSFVVTVNAVEQLIPDLAHEGMIRKLAHNYGEGLINTETYGKIVKYFHRAKVLDFDIEVDGNAPGWHSDSVPEKTRSRVWGISARDGPADLQYKAHLEDIAERGFFVDINLGFMDVPLARGDNVPVNFPPLVLKSPANQAFTVVTTVFEYRLSPDDFMVVDDSGVDVSIDCTIDGVTERVKGEYKRGYYGNPTVDTRSMWELGGGNHAVSCQAIDNMELSAIVPTYTLEVNVKDPLISNPAHSGMLKKVAGLHGRGVIDTELYGKVLKYYHTAGILNFDIEVDGNSPGLYYDNGPHKNISKSWGNGEKSDLEYKAHLEDIAERGFFANINLGF